MPSMRPCWRVRLRSGCAAPARLVFRLRQYLFTRWRVGPQRIFLQLCRSRPISAPVLPSFLAQLLLLISPLLPSWLAQLLVLQRRARRTRPARLACVQMLSACSRQPRAAWGRTSLQQGRKQTCKARESKDKQNFISATPYLQNRKHGQVRIKYKLINISYSYKYDFPVWY